MSSLFVRLGWVIALLALLWATLALWFVHPIIGSTFVAACTAGACLLRHRHWASGLLLLVGVIALAGWSTIPARNTREWTADVARTSWAEISGDVVTLHHVRAFEWRTETDFTSRWETRTYRISQLRHMDFFMCYWGSPHLCHTMVTFDFGADGKLCASIEARRENGEPYSVLGGALRRFELVYVFGDERDVVRLRTDIRANNDVYLYRLAATPSVAQAMFVDYINRANALNRDADWYNTLTTNCSTTIRTHLLRADVSYSWDWRLLLNGHADERLYQLGFISRELPLTELKRRSHINAAAHTAGNADIFSDAIRAGRPGF